MAAARRCAGVVTDCPKRMVYGPCGGVRPGGDCELGDRPCAFVGAPLPVWSGPVTTPAPPAAGSLLDVAARRPVVLVDLTVAPYDVGSVRRVVSVLGPVADGLLVGEHQNRPDLPPTLLATEILASGGKPWLTLTCRDRNRVVLEQELAGLRALGVPGVLCVTGDARGQGVAPEATQVFDLDGVRLAALAATTGLTVAVPESPASPPVDARPGRVAQKQRAGASLCVLNHVAAAADVASFVGAARRAGATLPFLAAVAVFTDEPSARVLARFPGLQLDPATVADVLGAPDPEARGIELAAEEARRLLAIEGVVGVNLSGLASGGGPERGAHVKAAVARAVAGTGGRS